MSHKASFTSACLFVPLLALPRQLLSSSTIISVIQVSPSFGSWFLIFLVYLRLSVSHVSLGNILVSLVFRYFVTFIDDYSQCTWLFLMKTQAKLFSIFQNFHVEIRTQFYTSICILRSDNAKEYFSVILFFYVFPWDSSPIILCLHYSST